MREEVEPPADLSFYQVPESASESGGHPFVEGRVSDAGFTGKKGTGRVESYFSEKGLGWLLEVDDDLEDTAENPKSLMEELDIDVSHISRKIRCVLFPYHVDRSVLMGSPDFWGPFAIVCLYGCLLLWGQYKTLPVVLLMWFLGSFVIFLLIRVLGGLISYPQSLDAVGYSMLPLCLTVIALFFISKSFFVLSLIVRTIGVSWNTVCAGRFLERCEGLESRKGMIVYPMFLLSLCFLSLWSGL